jgi:maltooligosyltrehalose trehalohydrolase
MRGERLISLAGFEAAKLAAGAVILSPYIPLLFMGEEYGEDRPFPYFVSFDDKDLIEGVRAGRKREFKEFHQQGEPPDPQDPATFDAARLDWTSRRKGDKGAMNAFYRELLRLRGNHPVLNRCDNRQLEGWGMEGQRVLWLRRHHEKDEVWMLMNFNRRAVECPFPARTGSWDKLLDSTDRQWRGPGARLPTRLEGGQQVELPPHSLALFTKEN